MVSFSRGRIYEVDGKPLTGWGEPREPFLLESSVPGDFCGGGRSAWIDKACSFGRG